ncbi:carboxymuconolactone decarboxylase [Pedobacter sp. HMF7647]|uniref:Carboxymuconolactone decarboxylase n=1 Tax=Hufsiella arboris TaxID=2695275 RepID=A0A7K1YEY1_9SPHI|nr:carboxymuconolactone decarboxylase family protein [Hufsiella arboris]MXV53155.1 carboxymuconolactone decarboxylase [Hufsiella arboris]
MKNLAYLILPCCIFFLSGVHKTSAQPSTTYARDLSSKHKSIVDISSLAARGNLTKLNPAVHNGLNAGLTVNEIKELMVHLSAYCGFPRSLNAINTFIAVSNERKAKGITDPIGAQPTAMSTTANKYETGKKNLEMLTGRAESGTKTGYGAFVPAIDTLLKEHLFADIFGRGVLTNLERELITVSALSSLGGVESQLQGHLSISMRLGWTEKQLGQMLNIVESNIGTEEANAARTVLTGVVASGTKPD